MADPVPLNRDQIAAFVGGDPASIRAIERLFTVAGDLVPADIALLKALIRENALSAGAAGNTAEVALTEATDAKRLADFTISDNAKAEMAIGLATDAKRLADLVATAPAPIDPRLDQLQDVQAFGAADGSILIYNAAQGAWVPTVGASGSFTAGLQTVTVVNGIITSIV
jgi:hypothetical protein